MQLHYEGEWKFVPNHPFQYFFIAIQCDALFDPANGTVSTTGTGVGDTATYTCDDGYELSGSGTLTCLSSGEWSGLLPTCEGKYVCIVAFSIGRSHIYM